MHHIVCDYLHLTFLSIKPRYFFFVRYFNFYCLFSDAVEVYLGDMETGPVTSTPRKRKEKEDIPSSTPKKRPKLYRLDGRHGPGRGGKAQNPNIVIQPSGKIRKKIMYIYLLDDAVRIVCLGPKVGTIASSIFSSSFMHTHFE